MDHAIVFIVSILGGFIILGIGSLLGGKVKSASTYVGGAVMVLGFFVALVLASYVDL